MNICFRKTKGRKINQVSSTNFEKYQKITRFARRGKAQRKVAQMYIKELLNLNSEEVALAAKENIRNIMEKLTIDNKFSPDSFWKVCKKSRNKGDNAASVETATGVELCGDDMILNAYLEEFTTSLSNNK